MARPLKRLVLMAGWHGGSGSARLLLLRRCMSASSWREYWDQSSQSKASEKKAPSRGNERLASVLDAIHERKLPPELRGRPNAIRYLPFFFFDGYAFGGVQKFRVLSMNYRDCLRGIVKSGNFFFLLIMACELLAISLLGLLH